MRDSSGRSLSSAVLSSLHSHPKNAGHEATVRTDETMAMTLGPQELRGGVVGGDIGPGKFGGYECS